MAFIPVKEYKVLVDGGATPEPVTIIDEVPLLIADKKIVQAQLYAKNADIVVNFDGTVADATLTGIKRTGRNFTVPAGAVILQTLDTTQISFSAIAEDETNTEGILIMTVGYGENT